MPAVKIDLVTRHASGDTFSLTKTGTGGLHLLGVVGTGTGGVSVSAGTLRLAGINTYTGNTYISGVRVRTTSSALTTPFGTGASGNVYIYGGYVAMSRAIGKGEAGVSEVASLLQCGLTLTLHLRVGLSVADSFPSFAARAQMVLTKGNPRNPRNRS